MRKINWPLWLGLVTSVFALMSYPFIFVNWETTRDFPWANIILFILAVALLFIGVGRAYAPGRRLFSKIIAPVVATVSLLALAMFIFTTLIAGRWLPRSTNAPQVGQKAPDFTLTDTNNRRVSLSDLLSRPVSPSQLDIPDKPPKGVLLIFYRGYW